MGESGIAFGAVGRGALWGLLAAPVLTAVAALFLSFSADGATYTSTATMALGWVCVLVGGIVAGRTAGRAGLLHGAVTGVVVVLLAITIGTLAFDVPVIGMTLLTRSGVALVVGAVGGALGVAF